MKLFIVITLSLCVNYLSASRGATVTSTLNSLFENYDRRVAPDGRVNVSVTTYITRQYGFSDQSNDFVVELYFRQKWTDPRLVFSGSDNILGGQDIADKIWFPDTFFSGSNGGSKGMVTQPNTFVTIEPSGLVHLSSRFTTKAVCQGSNQLAQFPSEERSCHVDIESYAHTMEDIAYEWNTNVSKPVGHEADQLEGFEVKSVIGRSREIEFNGKKYSRLQVEIKISRKSCAFIIRHFLPAFLVTLISFAPHFLDKSSKSRFTVSALILTSFLIVTALSNTKFAPKSGSVTNYDIFYLGNLITVAMNTLVVALVSSIQSKQVVDVESKQMLMNENPLSIRMTIQVGRLLLPVLYFVFLSGYTIAVLIA